MWSALALVCMTTAAFQALCVKAHAPFGREALLPTGFSVVFFVAAIFCAARAWVGP